MTLDTGTVKRPVRNGSRHRRLNNWAVSQLLTAGGLLLVAGVAIFLWHSYYKVAFHGMIYNDSLDYASLARNIVQGKGFISQYITPLGLVHNGVPQPDLWRAPLWPLLIGLFQRVFGFIDESSALAGGCCYVAGACLVYLLGRRWFNLPVALAASALYIFSNTVLEFSISGLTEPLAMLLMLLWFYLITFDHPNPWRQGLLAGIAGGFFYLARYNAILFCAPVLLFLLWRRFSLWRMIREGGVVTPKLSAWRPYCYLAIAFAIGALLITAPWLVRNYQLAGSPFFSLQKYEPAMFTKTYPGYSLYMRPEKVDVISFLKTHPDEVQLKLGHGWDDFSHNFFAPKFTGVAVPVMVLFLCAFLIPLDRRYPAQRGVRLLLAVCFLGQLAALLVLHYISRLFMIFMPFYMLYATGGVWGLVQLSGGVLSRAAVDQTRVAATGNNLAQQGNSSPGRHAARHRTSRAALVTALLAGVLLLAVTGYSVRANYPVFSSNMRLNPMKLQWGVLPDAARMIPADKVILSDWGQSFAWYDNLIACKIPYSTALLPQVCQMIPVGGLYLSNYIVWALPEADRSWKQLYYSRPGKVAGFKLAKVYPDGSLLYLRQ